MELFKQQDSDYQARILGEEKVRIGIEAAVEMGWPHFIGRNGVFIGMDSFGASAPAGDLYEKFGITAQAAFDAAMDKLGG